MKENDVMRLIRVAGFTNLEKKDKLLEVEVIAKNLEDRVANSAKLREECIKKVADMMKQQGITLENAFKYFDDDGSGIITREELVEGFNRMKVTMN